MKSDVVIVTTGHDVADARLHRLVAALVRANLTVDILALGSSEDAPESASASLAPRNGRLRRLARALMWPWRTDAHVIITLDPDAAVGARVRSLVGRHRPRFVADVHEDYAALLRDRPWATGWPGKAANAAAQLGARAAMQADLTVVADDHLLPEAQRRLVVRNLPDLSTIPLPRDPEPNPRAIYVGDLRESRGLRTMVEAVRAAPAWTLDLVGPMNAAADRQWLAEMQEIPDLAGRLRWHGRLAPAQAWSIAEGAWAGLLLLDDTLAFRAAMPTKLYEYLAAGLAVLATPLPRVHDLLQTAGAGVLVTSASEAAAQLNSWAVAPEPINRLRSGAGAFGRSGALASDELDEFARRVATLAHQSNS